MFWLAITHTALAGGPSATIEGVVVLKGQTAGPVVVYVEGPGPEPAALEAPATVEQKNMKFVPHGLVVPPGTVVAFPNQDNRFHNVFSTTPGSSFDLGVYSNGDSESWTFADAGVVDVYCNKHQSMTMQVLVVPNAWFTEVAADGSFTIKGITPGKHRVSAWTPDHLLVSFEVHLQPGAKEELDFRLQRDPSIDNHLDKHGDHYPDDGDY